MSGVNLIVGDDGSNTLLGGAGKDLIYGFDPKGPQSQVSSITATRVASGLDQPLFAGAPTGDMGRLFVVEKTGHIKILDLASGRVLATPFLDVSSQISAVGEGGLIGLAFDPDYIQNGFFYVNMINTSGDTEIRRYHVSADPNQADAASATPIITIDQPAGLTNHKAGWLGFGPDGDLYAALGDGGGAGDPLGSGQDINSLLGKMLRLDVHGIDAFPNDLARNYAIPTDNMFVGTAGADEIFALGLRNPFRNSFDRGTGDFFIADVGQNQWEEINIGQGGANYGWNVSEGPAGFAGGTISAGTPTSPIFSYDHTVGHAIIGGYVYRGQSEGLQGQYFFADEVDNKVFTLSYNGSTWVATERTSQIMTDVGAINFPSSFGEDGRGNLYLADFDGDVFRLTPVVSSADQGDILRGFAGDDMLFGGSGNDLLDGGLGNDLLDGESGLDTAAFSRLRSAYTITRTANSLHVSGPDGSDTLTNVERLAFDDMTIPSGLAPTARDFNGDGYSDILLQKGQLLAEWPMNGTQIQPGHGVIGELGVGWSVAGTGDFNGDGHGDILLQNGQLLAEWPMNGTQIQSGHGVIGELGPGWSVADTGDFNGDGHDDILLQNGRLLAEWPMNGTQVQPSHGVIGELGVGWSVAGTGDFNGDGHGDILLQNGQLLAEWLMNGTQIQPGHGVIGELGPGWSVAGTGDFNGDGYDDILLQNGQLLAEWLMKGTQIQPGHGVIGELGPGWSVAGTGDFNGDSHGDILLKNGQLLAEWPMNGTQIQPSHGIIGELAQGWQVIG
jgi:glucose/arabinose dehydrogenase